MSLLTTKQTFSLFRPPTSWGRPSLAPSLLFKYPPPSSLLCHPHAHTHSHTPPALPPHSAQLTLRVQGCELFSDELLINNNKGSSGEMRPGQLREKGKVKASGRGLESGDLRLIWSAPHHYRRPSDTITSAACSLALQTTARPTDSDRPPLTSAQQPHTQTHAYTQAWIY